MDARVCSTEGCQCQDGYSGPDCDIYNPDTCRLLGIDCGRGGYCVNNNTLLYEDYEEPPYMVAGK